MRCKIALVALAAVLGASSALAQSPPSRRVAPLSAGKVAINQPPPVIVSQSLIAGRRPRDVEIARIEKVLDDLRRPRPVSP